MFFGQMSFQLLHSQSVEIISVVSLFHILHPFINLCQLLELSHPESMTRPKQTILEAEGEATKGSNQWLDVMKRKREVHEGIINLVHQKSSIDPIPKEEEVDDISNWEKKEVVGKKRKSESFRDEEYYISSVPQNQHLEAGLSVRDNEGFVENRLDAAVLDLVDDEASGMQAQKSRYHWMKNKFVKLNNGDRVTATGKIKTESGAKLKASATGIYKKWQQKSHKSINISGQSSSNYDEGRTSNTGGYQRGDKKFSGAGRGRRSIPNADVPSEIRNPEQMQKGRQQKAKELLRLKNKSAKDGKFPSKFQRNWGGEGDGKGRGNGRPQGHSKGRGNGRPQGHGKGKGFGKGNGKGPSKGRGGKGKMKGKGAR
ncbi:hypothetical protein PR202_gb03289 [Eleusine coracana subsp. coracana]|uniref:DBP10 C-terminal domain-containing protein n=1 Tax=Eleusine coracana subsp. coracana TaxID=191504 RepID=A0AAV5DZ13_ELECO|nr:hypothetical protein PR202_gb03208 [Eleusine coracana subsp. coracana]GJN16314.1 hypothetical protein PR202_gb03289 [Eleusine coracana subsp. coracana]